MKWEMDLPSSGATLYSSGTVWTLQQNKIFENALAKYDKDTPDRWEKVAAMLPGKNATEVRRHYEVLEEDVRVIEAGLVDLPSYSSSTYMLESGELDRLKQSFGSGGKGSSTKSSDQERKKGVPWTEEEHRLFLMGLNKYGKGDWRSISRNFVVSRTPTQVASHAQKYFIRLSSGNKDKRRSSIHDITSVNTTDRRQVPSQHASVGSSSIPATISQPPPLMYSSNTMGRTSLMNSLGSPAGDKPIMLSPYSLGLYAYRGLGSHSHSTIIPDSCLAVPHIEYCTHPTMRH